MRERLPSCGKTILTRETGGTGKMWEGSRSDVRGFRNFEPRTLNRAFLACLALHAPRSMALADFISNLLARIIHECRREAFETEARRGFSQVRPTQAYWQSVEEAEREKPRRARGADDATGIHE